MGRSQIVFLFLFFNFLSCNDGTSLQRRNGLGGDDAKAGQYLSVRMLDSKKQLEACDEKNMGQAVFISEESQMLICDGEAWQQVGESEAKSSVWVLDKNGALIGQSSLDTYLNLNGYVAKAMQVLLADDQVIQIRPTGELANTCHYESGDCSGDCLLDPGKIYIAAGQGDLFFKATDATKEAQSLSTFNSSTRACEPEALFHPAFVLGQPYDLKTEASYPFAAPLTFSFDN